MVNRFAGGRRFFDRTQDLFKFVFLAAMVSTIGYWVWPSILLAAFLTNLTTAGSVATSISIAVGNTLEGMLGAYLVSATCGVASLTLGGFAKWADYRAVWLTWG